MTDLGEIYGRRTGACGKGSGNNPANLPEDEAKEGDFQWR